MSRRTAVVVGATGLVGGELVKQLCADEAYGRVVALARRALEPREKLETLVVDFDRLESAPFEADDAFSALGTTIRKAGSQEAFRRVDHDYTLAFARLAKRSSRGFFLVSAYGADAGSRVFYNRVKGETEAAVRALGFETLGIVRPSFLQGERSERRVGEVIGGAFAHVASVLPFQSARRIRPVTGHDVAAALIALAKRAAPGTRVLESEEISSLAR